MRILAIDQSNLTGWCHGIPGAPPAEVQNGTFRIPPKLLPAKRNKVLYGFLRDMIAGANVGKVVFELPIMPKVTTFKTIYSLCGFATAIAWACDDAEIPCVGIAMQTWRSEFGVATQAPRRIKSATERRKWVKDQTVARCQRLGFSPEDDNAADAIGIWHCVAGRAIAKANAPTFDLFAENALIGG
jgi:hypothetical protein